MFQILQLALKNFHREKTTAGNSAGGTYAFFKNFLPRLGIKVHFVDITKT